MMNTGRTPRHGYRNGTYYRLAMARYVDAYARHLESFSSGNGITRFVVEEISIGVPLSQGYTCE